MNRHTLILVMLATFTVYSCTNEKSDPGPDCSISTLALEVLKTNPATCGAADGSFEVTATGGDGAYEFSVASSPAQSSGAFMNLAAGNYEVIVTDDARCSVSLEVVISNAEGVIISSVDTAPSGCKGSSGSVTVHASEGAEPYQYQINGGAFQEENKLDGLASGTHTVKVKDNDGCMFSQQVEITSGTSFSRDISPIISSNCAIPDCHGGNQLPDLRTFNSIQSNASAIRSLTGSRVMPQGGSLSQSEIDLIACWVSEGAQNN